VDAVTDIDPVLNPDELAALRRAVDETYTDPKVKQYLVDVVRATRYPGEYGLDLAGWVQYGASPRATLALLRASKAHAFLAGRGYVTPEDVKRTAPDVLRHRVMISYEAEAEEKRPDEIVQRVLDHLPVP
jgi:MoxR-like ATPase